MKNFKRTKGITLVALIITIIVLLVLAIVSIRLVMNGGIIEKAENGTKVYTSEEVQEQMKLAYSEWELAKWDGTAGNAESFIAERLQNVFGEKLEQNSVKVENGKVFATVNNIPYEYNVATGKSGEQSPGIVDLVTKDNYGDYIDLGQDVLGDSNKANDWKILYNDKNNTYGGTDGARVYAILADYLPNSNAAVTSAGFGTNVSETYNVYSSTSRENLFERLNNTEAWKTLISAGLQSKGAKVKGATTAEIIMASYNEKYNTNLNYTSKPYLYIDAESSKGIDTLYVPHPGYSNYSGCWGYWLASPYANDNDRAWIMGYAGDVDYDYNDSTSRGVCPVVSLPANIQVTKDGNVWTVVQ